jgi:hypothetical protein
MNQDDEVPLRPRIVAVIVLYLKARGKTLSIALLGTTSAAGFALPVTLLPAASCR